MSLSDPNPRIWLGPNNGRLAYLQAQAALPSTYWTEMQNSKSAWSIWTYALDYIIAPTTQKRDDLLAKIDTFLAKTAQNILIYEGLQTGEQVRDLALCFDWCDGIIDFGDATRRLKMKDAMMFQVFACFNYNDPWFKNLVATTWVSPGAVEPRGWGVDSPGNNYFTAMMKAPLYAWLSLYPNIPTDFNYPFGSATNRQTFQLPFMNVANPVIYTDIAAWVTERLEELALPTWDSLIEGGGWHEGVWYGASPMRNILDILATIKDAADIDHMTSRPNLSDRIMYVIFNALAGNATFEFGEVGPLASGASERMSVLFAVAANRDTAVGAYGQHWLNSGYSLAEAGNPASSYGHDFLLYDDRIAAIDWKPIVPKHWFAKGCGQFVSRTDWGTNDIAVMMSSFWIRQDHADHDQNQIQIYRAGHGGAGKYDGFLLCDAHAGSGNKQWESKRHCTYTLGAGGPNIDGVAPPSVGYEQRFGANSNGLVGSAVGEIKRQFGNSFYSYTQGAANDAYYAHKSQTSGSVGIGFYPKINDIFIRDMVHLKTINFVVVYDRVRMIGNYANQASPAKAMCHWHYPRVQPTDMGGGILRATNTNNRLWRRYIYPTALFTAPTSTYVADGGSGIATWRETIELELTYSGNPAKAYGRLLTVFEVCSSAQSAMTTPQAIVSLDATTEGVTIKKTGAWHHVVFSSAQDAIAPSLISYIAEKSGSNDRHIVCNLLPDTDYWITESFYSGSLYQYQIGSSGLVLLRSNSAGVLEFTRGQAVPPKEGKGGKILPSEGD